MPDVLAYLRSNPSLRMLHRWQSALPHGSMSLLGPSPIWQDRCVPWKRVRKAPPPLVFLSGESGVSQGLWWLYGVTFRGGRG